MSAAEVEIVEGHAVEEVDVDVEPGAMIPYTPQPVNLFGAASPAETVAQATEYANALSDVIRQRQLFKRIGNKDHVLVEGWTLLGSMLGVFPVLESAEPVDYDGVKGWRATVAAQTRNGDIVGRATALCLRSESRWKTADDYAVLSMAQTRATSKSLRAPLGFVIQLAGFSATPEAEIPAEEAAGGTTAARTTPPDTPAAGDPPKPFTEKQKNYYYALLGELEKGHPRSDGVKWDAISKAYACKKYRVSSRARLDFDQMSKLIEHTQSLLEAEKVPFGEGP